MSTIEFFFLLRLSCRKVEQMWFDLMMSYGDLGNFLRNKWTLV